MSLLVAAMADILVAVLLVATIVTSRRLSVRMSSMKADETAMRTTVRDLLAATEAAERAIGGLRSAVQESERVLGDRLGAAARHSTRLAEQLAAGEAVLDRVARLAQLSRHLDAAPRAAEPAVSVERRADSVPDRGLRATIMAAREAAFRAAGRAAEERAA